jgi:hypothetical protein
MILRTLALTFAVATTDAASPDPLAAIAVYAGTWRAAADQVDSQFSKAGHTSKLIQNVCWRAQRFYACSQIVDGKQLALVVYTWDPKRGTYGAYSIPADGGSAGSRGQLVIEGNDWTFPWDQQVAGGAVHVRVINHFVGRDRIEYRREISKDGVNWTVIEKGVEERQPSRSPGQ